MMFRWLHSAQTSVSAPDVAVTPPEGRWPDFIIIGAMKSGTTTLFRYLCRHPQAFMSDPKEPQYFSRDHRQVLGDNWYRGLFAAAGPDQLCGEASTCYSRWPHFGDVASRIASVLPHVKLIYVMRHPVERAYSHYGHLIQEWLMKGSTGVVSFEDVLAREPEIIDAGHYARQIARYLEHFPREQLLLLTTDQLRDHPERTLETAQRFIGLPVRNLYEGGGALVSNRWGERAARHRLHCVELRVKSWLESTGLLNLLPTAVRGWGRRVINDAWLTRRVAQAAVQRRKRLEPLRQDTRRRLLEVFDESTRELEDMLGADLSHWRE